LRLAALAQQAALNGAVEVVLDDAGIAGRAGKAAGAGARDPLACGLRVSRYS
jgi:hypothetical protein